MTDDSDLTRLFAETATTPEDEAFVASVTQRIAWRRRLVWAVPTGATLLLVFAIWATWPAAYAVSGDAISGLQLIVGTLTAASNTPVGMLAATALLATFALWTWLYERVRAR